MHVLFQLFMFEIFVDFCTVLVQLSVNEVNAFKSCHNFIILFIHSRNKKLLNSYSKVLNIVKISFKEILVETWNQALLLLIYTNW